MTIVLCYQSCDGCSKKHTFKTLKGARKYAQEYVGEHPDIGSSYAVSYDGIGTISIISGTTLAELFPPDVKDLAA